MSHPIDAAAADAPPAEAAAAPSRPAGWTLIEDAPEPDQPVARDRAGAARGLWLLLVAGGLFWALVAAAIWYVIR